MFVNKNNLEEITIHEVNRIGYRLESDLKLLSDTPLAHPDNEKELMGYMQTYIDKISIHNEFVRESNSYKFDHYIKYYIDKQTGELSYKKRKHGLGFLYNPIWE